MNKRPPQATRRSADPVQDSTPSQRESANEPVEARVLPEDVFNSPQGSVALIDHEGASALDSRDRAVPGQSIGALLVDSGKITMAQAEKVLELQKRLSIRFGEAAVRLKVVTEDDIRFALARQHGYSYLRKGTSRVSTEARVAFDPYGTQAEVLRALRSQLLLRWFIGQPQQRLLSIVSPGPKEGRSYIAANLAVAFSQLGQRTLLVDCDLRNPRQHEIFGADNQLGLATVLSERSSFASITQIPGLPNLSLLSSGPMPPNPQELLCRDLFPQTLDQLSRSFDVVLCDTPNCHEYADAHTIAVRTGGALMVLRQGVTKMARAESLTVNLETLGVTLVGAVLNHG